MAASCTNKQAPYDKSLRQRYRIQEGDGLTLLDLSSVFVLAAGRSQVDELAGRIAQALQQRGESLESTLQPPEASPKL